MEVAGMPMSYSKKNRAKKKREGELMLLWENEAAVVLLQEFRIEKS